VIKNILIPTDGYGLEDHVVKYVARAFPFSKFYVVSIINTYERGVQLTNLLYDEMRANAKKAIERAKNILEEEGIKNARYKILEGLPSRSINKYAKKKDIDIIALRVYSRKATASSQRMGSTIKNVIKKSITPVLTIAEECEKIPIKKILFTTDGTRKSKRAKNFSILFSSIYKAEMEVLHVMKEEEDKYHAEELVKNVKWKASFVDVRVKKSIEMSDDVVKKIVKHAGFNDIVIMGIGRKVLLWSYIGHVTQAIVTHSPIPVILVPCIKKRWKKRTLHK